MKIGDLVVRAYAWPCLDIGVVVDDYTYPDTQEFDEHIVHWGSGGISRELPEELDYVNDVYEDLKVAFNI